MRFALRFRVLACGWLACGIPACSPPASARESRIEESVASAPGSPNAKRQVLGNRFAYIPPQCFTQVADGPALHAQNPCYVCHADAAPPNFASQPEVQLTYDFPQAFAGAQPRNVWRNVFRDLRGPIAEIGDAEVRAYVNRDNYRAGAVPEDARRGDAAAVRPRVETCGDPVRTEGCTDAASNALARSLAQLPAAWDVDGDGRWAGYVPDAYFDFDERGFDRAPDGVRSGYRTFAYYPLPGAFMPSNGSFDDVLIRLPLLFRRDGSGREDYRMYAINLAVVEAMIKRADVAIEAADERTIGVDLDRDGVLGEARRVRYAFVAGEPRSMSYVGAAREAQLRGELPIAPGLFPAGTEFLHSVRYLAAGDDGSVRAAPRMKELRYARKSRWASYAELRDGALREAKEAVLNPDRAELFLGDAERGLSNQIGWVYQGFIEDQRGELRPQTHEETLSCMGCHGGLSATEDSAFAFPRKLQTGPAFGWFAPRWGQDFVAADPLRADGEPEYATYLKLNPEGDGYRSNDEVHAKFFDAAGRERAAAFEKLASDASALLVPSAARALQLNKAYWVLVREQSFHDGRDAVLAPRTRALRDVTAGTATGIASAEPAPRLRL